jgi:hypothetical protein
MIVMELSKPDTVTSLSRNQNKKQDEANWCPGSNKIVKKISKIRLLLKIIIYLLEILIMMFITK